MQSISINIFLCIFNYVQVNQVVMMTIMIISKKILMIFNNPLNLLVTNYLSLINKKILGIIE